MNTPTSHTFDLIGVGAPVMDLLARVDDTFLQTIGGEKGGMELVDPETMESLLASLPEVPQTVPGGSAANTVLGATRLGLKTTFLGKLGDDTTATTYRQHCEATGVNPQRFKSAAQANARCLSLVTPDAQRTMRTCLAAAMTLSPDEISPADFHGCRHAHIEGYLLFNQDLAAAVLDAAKSAGCSISLDLASFEVVHAGRPFLENALHQYVDIVFANEDEAAAFFPGLSEADALNAFLDLCPLAAVKLGARGALVANAETSIHAPARSITQAVDTTGAGDAWAAGFLYAHLTAKPLASCADHGALLGAEAVQVMGPSIPEHRWEDILRIARSL